MLEAEQGGSEERSVALQKVLNVQQTNEGCLLLNAQQTPNISHTATPHYSSSTRLCRSDQDNHFARLRARLYDWHGELLRL